MDIFFFILILYKINFLKFGLSEISYWLKYKIRRAISLVKGFKAQASYELALNKQKQGLARPSFQALDQAQPKEVELRGQFLEAWAIVRSLFHF